MNEHKKSHPDSESNPVKTLVELLLAHGLIEFLQLCEENEHLHIENKMLKDRTESDQLYLKYHKRRAARLEETNARQKALIDKFYKLANTEQLTEVLGIQDKGQVKQAA